MEFQAVSLVELFCKFKSYGISNCTFGWIIPQVQVLQDFKLRPQLNGFQGPEGQKGLHIQRSIGPWKITLLGTAQPQTKPHNPQKLPPQPHSRQSTKFSQFTVHFNWFTTTPHLTPPRTGIDNNCVAAESACAMATRWWWLAKFDTFWQSSLISSYARTEPSFRSCFPCVAETL